MISAERLGIRLSPGLLTLLAASLGSGAAISVAIGGPTVGIAIVFAVAMAIVAAIEPGLLLGAYLLIPFYKAAVSPYVPVDVTVILAVVNAMQIVPLALEGRRRNVSRAGLLLWVGLALLVLGSVLYAPDQGLGINRAVAYWALVFLPIVPAAMRVGSDVRHVRHLLWTFIAMGVLTAVVGLTQVSGTDRLVVLGMNTINEALVVLLVPLLGVSFVLHERSFLVRLLMVLMIPGAVLVAVASGSRGPILVLLVLAAAGIVLGVPEWRSVSWRRAAVIAAAGIVSVVLVSTAIGGLPARSIDRFVVFGDFVESGLGASSTDPVTGDTSSATRVTLFGVAATLFEEHPVLGTGTGGYEVLSNRFLGYTEQYPHDAFMQIAAEYGAVGLVIFGGLVVLALARRLPRGSAWRATRIVFIYFLLEASVGGDILSDRTTLGLLMLLLLVEVPQYLPADDRSADPAESVRETALTEGAALAEGRSAP
ncbi:MAG: O-antigen ligase family protein [Chloroflexi bacterium]|nr:MAG: O-antigen ligase family protein [Chloroflexota bacterium]